jgi:hypothetical protein
MPSLKQRQNKIPVDADSVLTHREESRRQIIASTEFVFRSCAVLRKPCGEYLRSIAMYYGFYLFAIALAVMLGQLAFALYQVASLFLS